LASILPFIKASFEQLASKLGSKGTDMNKVNRLKVLAAVVFVIGATMVAVAEPVEVRFAGLGGQNQNRMYTYPYYLTLDNGSEIAMICDDYFHLSNVGDTWTANITNLATDKLSHTRFGDLTKYEEAAYLLMQINDSNETEWGNINFAIWKTLSPEVDPGITPPGTLGPKYWLDLAQSINLSEIDFSAVKILTPLNKHSDSGDQEFMFLTPEPGTLLLIGGGLLGLFCHRKRSA